MESTMASGMPISWIPMSDGWKSISGTAKRSLASLRICSPVLYFPLKTISSLGWWTERQEDQGTALCNHNPNVFSHLAEAFFDGAEVWKDIIPHHVVFLPLQPDNRQALATLFTSFISLSVWASSWKRVWADSELLIEYKGRQCSWRQAALFFTKFWFIIPVCSVVAVV